MRLFPHPFQLLFFLVLIAISNCPVQAQHTLPKRLQLKARKALNYCQQNNMDTTFCILVDMQIHSGKNRLFVWDFNNRKVLHQGVCSHGSCDGKTGPGYTHEHPKFSNKPSSYCSSLGMYRVGKRSYSNWGIHVHYKLHGLEKTNSNAFKRIIVLHSYEYVPEIEIYPDYIVNSWGCPMVSNPLMKKLDLQLKLAKCPVLLWIYN